MPKTHHDPKSEISGGAPSMIFLGEICQNIDGVECSVISGEIPEDDFMEYLCRRILRISSRKFLGTISANIDVVKYLVFSGGDVWGQFQQTFIS